MIGQEASLKNYDSVNILPCRGKFFIDEEKYPRIINAMAIVYEDNDVWTMWLGEEFTNDITLNGYLESATTEIPFECVLSFFCLEHVCSRIAWEYEHYELTASDLDSICLEEMILPLINNDIAVSQKVLRFMEQPLTEELLQTHFPGNDLPWNKPKDNDPEAK